jgi:hypothetical protein
MNMEQVEKFVQTDTTTGEREMFERDRERIKHIGTGSHLNEWLEFGPGMLCRRTLAMRMAHTNSPQGKAYNMAMSQLMARDGLDEPDLKTTFRAILWLYAEKGALDALRDIRAEMSLGERARFNSPITARQRVTKRLAAQYEPADPGELPEKVPTGKQKLEESVRQLEEELTTARAKIKQLEKLDGGLFDLFNDTANDIAATIVRSISPTKAGDIARAIQKAIKAAKAAHAG